MHRLRAGTDIVPCGGTMLCERPLCVEEPLARQARKRLVCAAAQGFQLAPHVLALILSSKSSGLRLAGALLCSSRTRHLVATVARITARVTITSTGTGAARHSACCGPNRRCHTGSRLAVITTCRCWFDSTPGRTGAIQQLPQLPTQLEHMPSFCDP